MKDFNDLQVLATIGVPPREMPPRAQKLPGGNDLQILFPLVWTQGGVTNLITCSAISRTAKAIVEHLQPGVPVLTTGTLDQRAEGLRYRLSTIQRLVTPNPVITVQGPHGGLCSLDGGEAHVVIRGYATEHSVPLGEGFKSYLLYVDAGKREHRFPVFSNVAVRRRQAVSVYGRFERFLDEDEKQGRVVAHQLYAGESIIPWARAEEQENP